MKLVLVFSVLVSLAGLCSCGPMVSYCTDKSWAIAIERAACGPTGGLAHF